MVYEVSAKSLTESDVESSREESEEADAKCLHGYSF